MVLVSALVSTPEAVAVRPKMVRSGPQGLTAGQVSALELGSRVGLVSEQVSALCSASELALPSVVGSLMCCFGAAAIPEFGPPRQKWSPLDRQRLAPMPPRPRTGDAVEPSFRLYKSAFDYVILYN